LNLATIKKQPESEMIAAVPIRYSGILVYFMLKVLILQALETDFSVGNGGSEWPPSELPDAKGLMPNFMRIFINSLATLFVALVVASGMTRSNISESKTDTLRAIPHAKASARSRRGEGIH
jgi:hypothetical protein